MNANFPLAIHGLSPEEIRYIAELENMSIRAVIERLIAAGLDSIPGGGAEILDDEIRYAISPLKCTTDVWLEVMRQGHALGGDLRADVAGGRYVECLVAAGRDRQIDRRQPGHHGRRSLRPWIWRRSPRATAGRELAAL